VEEFYRLVALRAYRTDSLHHEEWMLFFRG
jgi:hypothetical protein